LKRVDEFVGRLQEVFGGHSGTVNFEDFCAVIDSGNHIVADIFAKMGVTVAEVQQLLFSLSRQGNVDVLFEQFVVGCIKMRDPATRADLLTLTDAVEIVQAHLEDNEYDMSLSRPFEQTLSLMSTPGKSLKVTEVRESDFVRKLLGQDLLCRLQNEDDRNQFRRSVASVVNVILRCDGGCGFVISTMAALTAIQRKRVDFQATDKRGDYPRGYMTERLNDVHIDNPAFLKAMNEFCAHSASDRWPADHEAHGLPKDGYTLLTHRGRPVKCATKIVGLPSTPYAWDGVGTRHMTALGLCWALRFYPSIILVRSDGGQVHGLSFSNGEIVALSCVKGSSK